MTTAGTGSDASANVAAILSSREQFLGYIRRKIDDPEQAEDVLQESLIKALRAAPELRDQDRLVPWFYRVLRHAIVDIYRRRGVECPHVDIAAIKEPAFEPEEEAALCACFAELIPTLKPEYAELLRRLDLGDEEPEAVASGLGITTNNLKVRRHRARQALRKRLEETCRTCAEHHCLDCTCQRG